MVSAPKSPGKNNRRLRTSLALLGCLVLLISIRGILGHYWQQITIAPETTRALAPLHSDGTIDYIAALNAHYSQGVTPENNAAIFIPQIYPPQIGSASAMEHLCELLHLPPPSSQPAFHPFERYDEYRQRRLNLKKVDGAILEQWRDEFTDAGKSPWAKSDHPELSAWLTEQSPAFECVTAASRRPRFFVPFFPRGDDATLFQTVLPFPALHREIAQALAARGMMNLAAGNTSAAAEDALAIIRLGLLVGQQPSTIERLIAFSITNAGLDLTAALLASPALSAKDVQLLSAGFNTLAPLPSMTECVDIYDRFQALDQITSIARYGPNDNYRAEGEPHSPPNAFSFGFYPVHFNPVLRETNTWADELIAAASTKRFADREIALMDYDARTKRYLATLNTSSQSALRRFSLIFFSDDFRARFRVPEKTQQTLDLIKFALSARAHFAATPPTEASVKEWASHLPADRYEGNPLTVTLTPSTLTLFCKGPEPLANAELSFLHLKPTPLLRHDFKVTTHLP